MASKSSETRFIHIAARLLFRIVPLKALALLFFLAISNAQGAEISLEWDLYSQPTLAGYRIYYGYASNQYEFHMDVGTSTRYTISNLEDGKTYYFAATAYGFDGSESSFSDELEFASPPQCTHAISPESQFFSGMGGSGTVEIRTPLECTWTAISNASWLIITSNSMATGDGKVNFSALPNMSSTQRTGTLMIAGQIFSVTQEGFPQVTITATTGRNGSISPHGKVSVNYGENQTFMIAPKEGFRIAEVIVDGVSQGAIVTYTFSNVTADHRIKASFSREMSN